MLVWPRADLSVHEMYRMPTELTPASSASRLHPDDAHSLGKWWLYGPRDPRIIDLVTFLAHSGIRLEAIETSIVEFLEKWRAAIDEQPETKDDRS